MGRSGSPCHRRLGRGRLAESRARAFEISRAFPGSDLAAGQRGAAPGRRPEDASIVQMGHGPDLRPGGSGQTGGRPTPRRAARIERRFALIGQTAERARRARDIPLRRSARRRAGGLGEKPLWLQAAGPMAGNAGHALITAAKPVTRLDLHQLPKRSPGTARSHLETSSKTGDLPQALAIAAERTPVRLYTGEPEGLGRSYAHGNREGARPGRPSRWKLRGAEGAGHGGAD